jgi:hypothetical protein
MIEMAAPTAKPHENPRLKLLNSFAISIGEVVARYAGWILD